ncbi:hypothetical protein D3C76_1690340 [compost metagenome]
MVFRCMLQKNICAGVNEQRDACLLRSFPGGGQSRALLLHSVQSQASGKLIFHVDSYSTMIDDLQDISLHF